MAAIKMERILKKACAKHGVIYIPPKLDSTEAEEEKRVSMLRCRIADVRGRMVCAAKLSNGRLARRLLQERARKRINVPVPIDLRHQVSQVPLLPSRYLSSISASFEQRALGQMIPSMTTAFGGAISSHSNNDVSTDPSLMGLRYPGSDLSGLPANHPLSYSMTTKRVDNYNLHYLSYNNREPADNSVNSTFLSSSTNGQLLRASPPPNKKHEVSTLLYGSAPLKKRHKSTSPVPKVSISK
jgi:hypothetical protein